MVYVISDVHGDFKRLWKLIQEHKTKMTEKDILIVLGDFGVWEETMENLKQLCESVPIKILFLDGNHESFKILADLPTEEKWGGLVQNICGAYRLCRGEVFTLPCDGGSIRVGVLGGGTSRDLDRRVEGVDWFPEEEITDEDVERLIKNVKEKEGIDYLLTHSLSATPKLQLCAEQTICSKKAEIVLTPTNSDRKVRNAISALEPYEFVCMSGHEHMERKMVVNEREYQLVYHNILPLNVREKRPIELKSNFR